MKSTVKNWHDMTTLERAEHCERIAEQYSPGLCRELVFEQAARLWAKAESEKENNQINKGEPS